MFSAVWCCEQILARYDELVEVRLHIDSAEVDSHATTAIDWLTDWESSSLQSFVTTIEVHTRAINYHGMSAALVCDFANMSDGSLNYPRNIVHFIAYLRQHRHNREIRRKHRMSNRKKLPFFLHLLWQIFMSLRFSILIRVFMHFSSI